MGYAVVRQPHPGIGFLDHGRPNRPWFFFPRSVRAGSVSNSRPLPLGERAAAKRRVRGRRKEFARLFPPTRRPPPAAPPPPRAGRGGRGSTPPVARPPPP